MGLPRRPEGAATEIVNDNGGIDRMIPLCVHAAGIHAGSPRGGDSPGVHAQTRQRILMNILNPKVLLFFIAFFPQFVSPATENPAGELLILGLLFMAQAIVIFTLVALLADRLSRRLMQNARFSLIMHIIESLVYFAIGISLIFVTV